MNLIIWRATLRPNPQPSHAVLPASKNDGLVRPERFRSSSAMFDPCCFHSFNIYIDVGVEFRIIHHRAYFRIVRQPSEEVSLSRVVIRNKPVLFHPSFYLLILLRDLRWHGIFCDAVLQLACRLAFCPFPRSSPHILLLFELRAKTRLFKREC